MPTPAGLRGVPAEPCFLALQESIIKGRSTAPDPSVAVFNIRELKARMPDLPKLPEPVRRKLALKWSNLLETRGFTGGHLQWHQAARETRRRHMELRLKNPVSRRAGEWFSPDYPQHVDATGIVETVGLTKERFGQVADEYFRLWSAEQDSSWQVFGTWLKEIQKLVITEVADLWSEGGDWHVNWLERACRTKIYEALERLIAEQAGAARKLEIEM